MVKPAVLDRSRTVPVQSLPVQMMTPSRSTRTDRRPTLATLAEAVGVSRMTVSNAFNRPDQLSPALRERILATAREIGYAGPNPVARTLSRGATGSVGLVVDYALTQAFTDPATVQFLHGVAAGCEQREAGFALVPRIEGRDAALVHTALVDGFVLYCMAESDPRLDAVRNRRLPYVDVDHQPDPGPVPAGRGRRMRAARGRPRARAADRRAPRRPRAPRARQRIRPLLHGGVVPAPGRRPQPPAALRRRRPSARSRGPEGEH